MIPIIVSARGMTITNNELTIGLLLAVIDGCLRRANEKGLPEEFQVTTRGTLGL
jgi:hypothetical protein